MTRHAPALLALSVLAIAGWTYNVNYDTRAALDRLSELRARIAEEREALQVLRVEWAWLNAPDRLARLVVAHGKALGLGPLKPEALGQVAAVPYPRGVPETPVPGVPPEALIAALPGAVPAAAPALASAGDGAEPEPGWMTIAADPEEGGIDIAALGPLAEAAGEAAGTLQEPAGTAGAPAAEVAGAPAPRPAAPPDPVVVAAAGKAQAITAQAASAPAEPVTMQDAVALALIEAGVVQLGVNIDMQQGGAAAAVIPVSASGAIPVPPARPAVWARR